MPSFEGDPVLYRLQEIKDTISIVATNTTPINDLSGYYSHTDGKIAVIALIVSAIAAIFSFLGYIYQKRSADLLERANHRRPSLYPLVKKLYDSHIMLQILLEYDSDYNMSYTAESKLPQEKWSSCKKHFLFSKYNYEQMLLQMSLPNDVIILEKYEIYKVDNLYNLAYTVRGDIRDYNRSLADICQHIKTKNNDKILLEDREALFTLMRRLIKELLFLDELVIASESRWYNALFFRKDTKSLQKEMAFYISSRLLSSLKNSSADIVLSDPNFIVDANIIDFDLDVSLKDFVRYKKHLDNSYKTKTLMFFDFLCKWETIKKNPWVDKKGHVK